jgi:hypothetical protein
MDAQFKKFNKLSKLYSDTLIGLFDFSYHKNLLPFKYSMFYDKELIMDKFNDNKVFIIQNGIDHFIKFKDQIQHFSKNELENSQNLIIANNIKKELLTMTDDINNSNLIIELLFDIINNAKNLNNNDFEIIKEYLLTIIVILEKLKIVLS